MCSDASAKTSSLILFLLVAKIVLGSTNLPMWLFFPEDTWNISFNKTAAESGVGYGNRDQLRKTLYELRKAAP